MDLPVRLGLTTGEAHDNRLVRYSCLSRLKSGAMLLADRGYDADWIRALATEKGAWANIPPRRNRKEPICFSPHLYRARNLVERFFNKIKQCRRVATRYDKLAANYLAFIQLHQSGYGCALMSSTPITASSITKVCRRRGSSWIAGSSPAMRHLDRAVRPERRSDPGQRHASTVPSKRHVTGSGREAGRVRVIDRRAEIANKVETTVHTESQVMTPPPEIFALAKVEEPSKLPPLDPLGPRLWEKGLRS